MAALTPTKVAITYQQHDLKTSNCPRLRASRRLRGEVEELFMLQCDFALAKSIVQCDKELPFLKASSPDT
ncbi:hypothetical protein LZ496_09335 [Sphingomonas sp. NSE70-1]|uniref:Uncharacterized protein n=1 Tax=Sphingomonas caseinilyticus TaxID=2908205 RepID=A0ABT0RVD2_9SPHN|nr:hypothetical protein [Sphingomonas caseinilyticus]MCL6698982.1 hypothetical protein [Sphingomonas caseinilyticus]